MLFHPRALLALDGVMPKLIFCSSPAAPDFWGAIQELLILTVTENFLLKYLFSRVKSCIQKLRKIIEIYKKCWKVSQTYYFKTSFAPKCKCSTLFNINRDGEHFAHRIIQLYKHNMQNEIWRLLYVKSGAECDSDFHCHEPCKKVRHMLHVCKVWLFQSEITFPSFCSDINTLMWCKVVHNW